MIQGNVTVIKHGSGGLRQVLYRLGGGAAGPTTTGDQPEVTPEAVAYRLGEQTDGRRVRFLGRGLTADQLGYRPGMALEPGDARTVVRAMAGQDVRTGEVVASIKTARSTAARVPAAPVLRVIRERLEAAGVEPASVFTGVTPGRSGAIWMRLEARVAQRGDAGTIGFREAMTLVNAAARAATRTPGGRLFDAQDLATAMPDGAWATAEAASGQRRVVGNAGYDMTFTAPKSYSLTAITAAPADRQAYLDAVEDAIRAATDHLMDRVGKVGLGHRGDGERQQVVTADGYAATVTIETYSRAEDPHFHGHVMIANRLFHRTSSGEIVEHAFLDGGRSLIAHSAWFQAEAMRQLRTIALERGLVDRWDLDPQTDVWECNGIDRRTRKAFSRMQAIMTNAAPILDGDTFDMPATARTPNRVRRALTKYLRNTNHDVGVVDVILTAHDAPAVRKPSKGEHTLSLDELAALTQARAEQVGIDLTRIQHAGTGHVDPASTPHLWDADMFAERVEQALCENKAITSAANIEAQIRHWAPPSWSESDIRMMKKHALKTRFVASTVTETWDPDMDRWELQAADAAKRQYLPFGSVDSAVYASRRMLEVEQSVAGTVIAGLSHNPHTLNHATALAALDDYVQRRRATDPRFTDLTSGQRDLYHAIVEGRDLVGAVIGAAGTGKTTAVDAARFALARHGQRIFGVSTASMAAQTLGREAGFASSSATRLIMQIAFDEAPDHAIVNATDGTRKIDVLRAIEHCEHAPDAATRAAGQRMRQTWLPPTMDRLIVDEASMMGAEDMDRLLTYAARRSIAVTMVGDPKQLGAIAASGLFGRIADALDAPELTENLRQRTDAGRAAAAFIRDGRVQDAFETLAAAGQFRVVRTHAEKITALADYWEQHAANACTPAERADIILEAQRNDEVDELNAVIAARAAEHGWTGPHAVSISDGSQHRTYREGDQIIVTENLHRRGNTPAGEPASLLNGTRGHVIAVDDRNKTVTFSWTERGEDGTSTTQRGTLVGQQIIDHSRLGYALTGHKTQGQTVDHIGIDHGSSRDTRALYVAVTRARDGLHIVVNIADILDGDELATVMRLDDDALQDWAAEYVATEIERRGFTAEITAHDAIEQPLFNPAVTARRHTANPWNERPYGALTDDQLATALDRPSSEAHAGLLDEAHTRLNMDPVTRARETRQRRAALTESPAPAGLDRVGPEPEAMPPMAGLQ